MRKISEETKALMREYKAQGHTNREVAETFNVNYETTKVVCRGIAHQSTKQEDKYVNEFNKRFGSLWKIVGEFKNVDSYIDIECKKCGAVRKFHCGNLRKHNNCVCSVCKKIEQEQQKAIELLKREERRKTKEQERIKKEELKRIAKQEKEKAKWHSCPVCGKQTNRPKYCSDRCRTKVKETNHTLVRNRRKANSLIDRDISLEGLYNRDKGICYLCGSMCDYSDYQYKGNYFVAGDFYPSIDHVIPLSKGGLHSWSNIKLAHRHCNSVKGDKE